MNQLAKSFKIRCSSLAEIMVEARSGSGLSKTAQSFCNKWIKEQLYKRKEIISTKYTQKGVIVEDHSIDFLATQLGYGLLLKNDEYFENEYLTGTPDVLPPSTSEVIDVKSSWRWTTFPLLDKDCPNKDYWWQLQGYMALTGRTSARLAYLLTDTPIHLIEREARRYCYDNGYDELDVDVYDEFYADMTYDDVQPCLKMKVFDFDRDETAIQRAYTRVQECREYIDTVIKNIQLCQISTLKPISLLSMVLLWQM